MFSALLIILILFKSDLGKYKSLQFRPLSKIIIVIFIFNFFVLLWLGAKHVESPFIELGQFSTTLYFGYFLFILVAISLIENTLLNLNLSFNNTIKNKHSFSEKSS